MKPRLLDLFCKGGGAAVGYHLAGFEVVGIDIEPQPNYPFQFMQGDALMVEEMPAWIDTFDAVHASPPCQASCTLTKGTNRGREYQQLIPATRAMLERLGLPFVIENVQGAAVRRDLTLCGEMFGLRVIRHRYFECSFPVVQPTHIPHRGRVKGWRHGEFFDGPYFAVYGDGGGKGTATEWQQAMGIGWTNERTELAEAIPPAYTQYVGEQLMKHLEARGEGSARSTNTESCECGHDESEHGPSGCHVHWGYGRFDGCSCLLFRRVEGSARSDERNTEKPSEPAGLSGPSFDVRPVPAGASADGPLRVGEQAPVAPHGDGVALDVEAGGDVV